MKNSDILRFFDNETLPLTSEQKFCLLSQETSFVTYTCDFAAVCPRLFATAPTCYHLGDFTAMVSRCGVSLACVGLKPTLAPFKPSPRQNS